MFSYAFIDIFSLREDVSSYGDFLNANKYCGSVLKIEFVVFVIVVVAVVFVVADDILSYFQRN